MKLNFLLLAYQLGVGPVADSFWYLFIYGVWKVAVHASHQVFFLQISPNFLFKVKKIFHFTYETRIKKKNAKRIRTKYASIFCWILFYVFPVFLRSPPKVSFKSAHCIFIFILKLYNVHVTTHIKSICREAVNLHETTSA